mmetsp:Transcript_42635/g.112911  ORF Transcript_42635/g.112911 Transcript_42635/m.112911 type:complete len:240 (-) Transcript_42635:276-995(-)
MVAAMVLEVETPSDPQSSSASSPLPLSSCLKRTPRAESLTVSWGDTEEFVVETEYSGCIICEPTLVANRLRSSDPPPPPREDDETAGEPPKATIVIPRVSTSKRGGGKAGRGYKLRSMPGHAPKPSKPVPKIRKPRKWTPRADDSKEQEPLPDGWREEVRMPLSGRQYRVFLGPKPGMYAESVAKAWECDRRVARRAIEAERVAEQPEDEKKKRPKKACLACDFGRKRKCTCGRRSRLW